MSSAAEQSERQKQVKFRQADGLHLKDRVHLGEPESVAALSERFFLTNLPPITIFGVHMPPRARTSDVQGGTPQLHFTVTKTMRQYL